MAAGFMRALAGDRVKVLSAGSEPAESLHPQVVEAMGEAGIDIAAERPELVTDNMARIADVVVTMGSGDACAFYPGKRYEDWELDDPAGQPIEKVRLIRDEIRERVKGLLAELVA
jgi:protein-tyrosine-phosphatase